MIKLLTLTAEPGVIGGIPASGLNVDVGVAVLGLAQADALGNLNVSNFGSRLAGAGGFINISQSASEVVFVGTFTAGDLQVRIEAGKVQIVSEGTQRKFVQEVEHCTPESMKLRARLLTLPLAKRIAFDPSCDRQLPKWRRVAA